MEDVSRRRVLQGLAVSTGLVLTGTRPAMAGASPAEAERAGRIAGPGTRPDPGKPEGADLLPQIDHIVIYMQENHSYDSYFGTYPRGDGYTMVGGKPTNSAKDSKGRAVPVFRSTETCQTGRGVSQSWDQTHLQIDGGAMDGWLNNDNTNAMKYWDGGHLPFYWSLADHFPLCDRWFGSAPCQTYPNRMYLQAATSQGLVETDTTKALNLPHPKGGTIWDKLNAFGISWLDYALDLPDIALFPKTWNANKDKVRTTGDFLADCASGTLPSVSIVSPGVASYTEENPADVQLGEKFTAMLVNAVMSSPAWGRTLMVFTYDEHGGYYDHVAPPAAITPDDIPPDIDPKTDQPGRFDLYGPRVPGFVISPYSRPGYTSSVVHDHTSILRLVETKFNLGALTRRDANASNLLDCLDLDNPPAFATPPTLANPGLPASGSSCENTPWPPKLVRTAPAAPETTTTAPPTTTAGSPDTSSGSGDVGAYPTQPGELARTGSQHERLALLGLTLLAAGGAAMATQHRLDAQRVPVSVDTPPQPSDSFEA